MTLDTYLLLLVVDHDVMRLDVSMHDSLGVAEIKCFEEFKDVVTNVKVCEFGIEGFELGVLVVSPLYTESRGQCES
jgi:hypothetical protein